MSINLPTHYVQQFSTNLQLLLQQKGSKLRDLVMTGSHVGKQASPVDQIGAISAQRRTSRFAPMGRVDAPTDRRWVFPVDWDLPQLIDNIDKLRMLTDPESTYVQNALFAMGRAMDDEILTSFFADAKTGEQGGTTTSFPSGQSISVGTGGAASGLNVAKLREVRRVLMANEVDLEAEEVVGVITAKQHDNLLAEIQVTSTDFNSQPVLVDGRVQRFMGIRFVHCERVDTGTDDAAGTSFACPFFVKSGVYLGMWDDVKTSISQRNDLQGEPWQAYVTATFGATRLEEKKVLRVWCR